MVLTTRNWQTVENNGDFKDLLTQVINDYQLVFVGYGFRDPDFEHIWEQLLVRRVFRMLPIYCCREGAVPSAQIEQFRAKNVQVLEFADDGSFAFIPEVLRALSTHRPAATPIVVTAPVGQQSIPILRRKRQRGTFARYVRRLRGTGGS